MDRAIIALVLLALFLGAGGVIYFLSSRYLDYQQALRRGDHDRKRVPKPFWFN